MILIAGGDSFIFGNELPDWYSNPQQYSQFTFPSLWAKQTLVNNVFVGYHSCARPGNSNDAIQRMTIQNIEQLQNEKPKEEILIVVAWTFVPRFEFPFEFSIDSPDSPFATISVYEQSNRSAVKDFAKTFFKNVSVHWYQHYNTVKSILILQNYLNYKKIPYLFTMTDNIVLSYQNDDQLNPYWKMVDFSKWFFFPPANEPHNTTTPRGFYQWAVENKYPVGPDKHPLEQAHHDAAILMKEKFNELVTQLNESYQIRN